jgi:hypothetical protein
MRTLSNYCTNLFFVEKGARFTLKRKYIEKDVRIIEFKSETGAEIGIN